MWLAKIQITKKMEQDHPDLADKLLNYQLKAKDILAAAFLPKQQQLPQTTGEKIALLAQGYTELGQRVDEVDGKVDSVRAEIESLKLDLPILPIEAETITNAVKSRGVKVMGGKDSNAYRDRSIVNTVYRDIYSQIYRNFGVRSYKAIKRSQTDKVIEVVNKYEPPVILEERIQNANAQQRLDV